MKRLNLKYAERAVIPAELVLGDALDCVYELAGGARVRFRYLMGVNVGRGGTDWELCDLCKRLYGMEFTTVRAVWSQRLGRELRGLWYYVEMIDE